VQTLLQTDVLLLILFCLGVGIVGGAVAILDVLLPSQDLWEAIRTKEGWALYGINLLLAAIIAYILVATEKFEVGPLSAIAIAVGYPSLLHQKFFTHDDTHWGIEHIYQRISGRLSPGIDESINNRAEDYLRRFRELPTDRIVDDTRDFLEVRRRTLAADVFQENMALLDQLLQDTNQNPLNQRDNNALIYNILYDLGGYRAIRRIIKRS